MKIKTIGQSIKSFLLKGDFKQKLTVVYYYAKGNFRQHTHQHLKLAKFHICDCQNSIMANFYPKHSESGESRFHCALAMKLPVKQPVNVFLKIVYKKCFQWIKELKLAEAENTIILFVCPPKF